MKGKGELRPEYLQSPSHSSPVASGLPYTPVQCRQVSILDSHFTNEKTDLTDLEPKASRWKSQAR